jgi:xanthine dehydrogenase accessory factor
VDIRLVEIENFIKQAPCVIVSVIEAKGSTPRNIDAFMLVNEQNSLGTIGGGNLEFLAIEQTKKMLAKNEKEQELALALNEKSNQCCGGRVKLKLQFLDIELQENLLKKVKQQEENLPHIYLFGAGHVGKALANLLAQMPYKTTLIDTRPDVMSDIAPNIKTKLTPLPETIVKKAKANSAFVIVTHDHALDFLILAEVLKRDDANYTGMIGSKTKRKKFEKYFLKNDGNQAQLVKIICPIGSKELVDKRPQIIAALTLGEIIANINIS